MGGEVVGEEDVGEEGADGMGAVPAERNAPGDQHPATSIEPASTSAAEARAPTRGKRIRITDEARRQGPCDACRMSFGPPVFQRAFELQVT